MKLFHASLLVWAILLLGSCIKEDTDGCETGNLVLDFRYYGDGQVDLFPENIYKVDVFVFDGEDHLVLQQAVDQDALNLFEGAKLSLSPGTYRIVCWGNVTDKAVFEGTNAGNLITDMLVGNRTLYASNEAEDDDPLFYAPSAVSGVQTLNVTVPPAGTVNETAVFRCAHICVQVYVMGFEDRSAQGELLPPVVSLTELPAYYDFDMQTFGPNVRFRKTSAYRTIGGDQVAVQDFATPRFNEQTVTNLLIGKQSDGTTLTTISLADYIAENNIKISALGKTIVPILVEYKQASVSVTLPGWIKNPVSPEL